MIQPKLSAFDLTMIVVSLVIGIGIFRTPAIVAQSAGNQTIFFGAWLTGGLVSLIGALTFAEIGSRRPVAGGFYKLISEAFHPVFAFMLNWVIVLTYGAGNVGVALIGAEYINPLLPASFQGPTGIRATVIVTVLLFYGINLLGIRSGARTQNLLSGLKVLMMGFLCLGAFLSPFSRDFAPAPTLTPDYTASTAFFVSLIAVFYTYGGYQQVLNFGADVTNPQRNTPRGVIGGMLLIMALYLTLNYAYVKQLGFSQLPHSKLVAADLARTLTGDIGYTFFSVAIFVSVLGYLNASLLSLPRVYYAMADDGILPPIFKRVNERTQTQEFALTFLVVVMLLSLFFLGTFEKIVSYVMSIDTVALASAAATLFVFRRRARSTDTYTGYRVWLYPVLPALFIGFLLVVSANVIITDPGPAAIGWGLFASGFPLYYLLKRVF
ncbi:amino acid/polyamine/organocation transporter (APC superfamily) [Spirosoma oryzae]|uniref:Amino acid/polyamine/organocation transporter (APC superfamily) n=1 Tax=Spirosoma oryzae TaxID=1469603 RepID=A0A2T0SMJ0_9BACT|nr:APC family permease [Spirosoma oryzae]PRY34615.1 amino acid/polyamine/organocation transporter (APC superfamily) [Spirosoma oryzae]